MGLRQGQALGGCGARGPPGTALLGFFPGCSPAWGLRPPCKAERVSQGGWASALLSTCRAMVASAWPAGLVALQMYWPESCWATRGMMSVSPSSRCCQGSGERSLDQWMVGVGLPAEWSERPQRSLGYPGDEPGTRLVRQRPGGLIPSGGSLSGHLSHHWRCQQ